MSKVSFKITLTSDPRLQPAFHSLGVLSNPFVSQVFMVKASNFKIPGYCSPSKMSFLRTVFLKE
uniref:Uncharacterized protein n=1 Tax=Sus scrofa TaxID=9823 RepID=A0A8D1IEV4_PIG